MVMALHHVTGHPETVRALLECGANIEVTNDNGWTPLMRAAAKGRTSTITVLLAHGAEIEARNDQGVSAEPFILLYIS